MERKVDPGFLLEGEGGAPNLSPSSCLVDQRAVCQLTGSAERAVCQLTGSAERATVPARLAVKSSEGLSVSSPGISAVQDYASHPLVLGTGWPVENMSF